jgi:hypothetical protein
MQNENRDVRAHTLKLDLARELQAAGLRWEPQWFDFFAIPDRGLDDRIFVLSDMTIEVQQRHGWPAITFNGAVEWSLDYILQADVVWLPTESQLRHALQVMLAAETQPAVHLLCSPDGFQCQIQFDGSEMAFGGIEASDAYAAALLHILTTRGEST